MLRDFQLAPASPHLANRAEAGQHQHWRKPPPGWVKLNWDAAINREKNLMGRRIIVRDQFGQVLTAMCSHQPYIIDPATAEAFAVRQGVELCTHMGFQRLMLEGDAQLTVTALLSPTDSNGRYGPLILDTHKLLDFCLSWSVNHLSRECNVVAHTLARFAVKNRVHRIWVGSYPTIISHFVLEEKEFSPVLIDMKVMTDFKKKKLSQQSFGLLCLTHYFFMVSRNETLH
jgi:hypothetical protein